MVNISKINQILIKGLTHVNYMNSWGFLSRIFLIYFSPTKFLINDITKNKYLIIINKKIFQFYYGKPLCPI